MTFAVLRFFSLTVLFVPLALSAQEPTLVAPGEAREPAAQQKMFHLPPGFEIQLVASEPDIGQPMNLQFDAAGRLWVTSSVEYPYPAEGPGVQPRDENFRGSDPPHAPRDTLTILADFDDNGRARSITKFATGLNIPIGHLPTEEGAIVYSIPTIKHYKDTDGDGQADEEEVLLTGFGNVDTHGMINGLRRGFDGWIYACHGFRNTSHIKGTDGSTLELNSGNIFRFRPDGSHLEQVAWGQVNPFGLTFDPRGDLYSADCHSMPLTCVLRGAYYPSFGKPHGGLGFGPTMINHSHGSTGICGPAYYAATQFPEEYRDDLYLCNPVTGQVHRDELTWTGSSPEADTQPDFITCEDGWFRPVDLAVGPDGALYIADFYNAVIGHYEVPLGHPKRDRTHGRIWRVIYTGDGGESDLPKIPNLTTASIAELVKSLGDPNLTVRLLATNELADRADDETLPLLEQVLAGEASDTIAGELPEAQRAHAMWVAFRLDALSPEQIRELASNPSALIRGHVARLLRERAEWSEVDHELAETLLGDDDPFVRRAAAVAIGRQGSLNDVRLLLDRLERESEADSHLRHALRIALKRIFSRGSDLAALPIDDFSLADRQQLANVLLAVKTPSGAILLAQFLEQDLRDGQELIPIADHPAAIGHVFRYAPAAVGDQLIGLLRNNGDLDLGQQLALLEAARTARIERNLALGESLNDWAKDLTVELLDEAARAAGWSQAGNNGDPTWRPQERPSSDGTSGLFWSSLPAGEQRTGTLRSHVFTLPEQVSFYLAGHAGFPTTEAHNRNVVRLHDAATGAVLWEAFPPRNDVAQLVEWPLRDVAGREGYLELVDGDDGGAYAWLAAGRFNVESLSVRQSVAPAKAAELVAAFELQDLRPKLEELLADETVSDAARAAAAQALAGLNGDPVVMALAPLAGDPSLPIEWRKQIATLAAEPHADRIAKVLAAVVQNRSATGQQMLAERLAESAAGAEALLKIIEQGQASPRLLTRPAIQLRLAAHHREEWKSRIESLTSDLPPEDEAVRELIAKRVRAYDPSTIDVERGAALFKQHCANCHRIGSEGALVGPQLDGIGVRGLERLAEDILDPNRNVDGAFRSSTIVTTDGRVLTGLFRREEGESLILADNKGEEFRVAKEDILEKVASPLSLMPANMSDLLQQEEFADLLAYLLTQRTKTEE